ncbi:hypothetical protein PIB30_048825 [Stylosanthes scabra]|uniref:PB1-like domain-containing protein n=1 Tax=Stylosanthes scabra TaxID=79078 RepID=A0ABU6SH04_9FABA|nr:hypothetical protein [Stylosanthes scabra]
MDIDFVNYEDLVKLLEGIGYNKFKCMKWYDFAKDSLERGLHPLKGDAHINEMWEHILKNLEFVDEFHIYVKHEVNIPIPTNASEEEPNVETVVVDEDTFDSSSSSFSDNGGYESADNELYKPSPQVFAMDTESEDKVIIRKRGIAKGEKPMMAEKRRTPPRKK